MIRMSRRVSIFSVVVVMTVTVLATVAVALAQEEPLDEPQNESGGGPVEKVSLCHKPEHKHNGHTITVGAPAVPAHIAHGDTEGACDDETLAPGTPEPPEGATLTTDATETTLPDGTISDVATLDVPEGTTGTIEFKLYKFAADATIGADSCTADMLVSTYTSTKDVPDDATPAGSNTYTSDPYTPTEPGIYQWTATFTPDSGQGDPTGEIGCGETVEQSVVNGGAPTTTTLTTDASNNGAEETT
jgi:hypothetical protein